MKKRIEIRIIDVPKGLYEKIKASASNNKRTVGKEAEFVLEQYYKRKAA